jgi:hypothetical protein
MLEDHMTWEWEALTTLDSNSTSSSIDLFRLEFCLGCGYRLEGLPAEGTCPECGKEYDRSRIVLFGYGRGTRADHVARRPWAIAILGVLTFVPIYFAWHLGMTVLAFVNVLNVPLFFLTVRRRIKNVLPGTARVEFSETEGCRQLDIRSFRPNPFTPWSKIGEGHVRSTGNGKCRLWVGSKVGRWRPPVVAVEADVDASVEKSVALRNQIKRWIQDAKAQPFISRDKK